MTDLQINIALAKAMGWESDQLAASLDKDVYAADWPKKETRATILQNRILHPLHLIPWRKFDYRDPVVFVAICKHWKLKANFFYESVCYDPPFNQPPMLIFASGETTSIEHAAALVVIELEGVKL